ncbi:MAG: hypothetical protein NTV34_19825 [Proteobacteria bacterium]|nr:hypothetical protein [Pseudomonadota bacterium]
MFRLLTCYFSLFFLIGCQTKSSTEVPVAIGTIDEKNPAGETALKNDEPLRSVKVTSDPVPQVKPAQGRKFPVKK